MAPKCRVTADQFDGLTFDSVANPQIETVSLVSGVDEPPRQQGTACTVPVCATQRLLPLCRKLLVADADLFVFPLDLKIVIGTFVPRGSKAKKNDALTQSLRRRQN